MERNLPIKFFQKRTNDERNTEGGGNSTPPKWYNEEIIPQKAQYFIQTLNTVSEKIIEKRKKGNYLPSVIKLKINEEALAKTYRKEIGKIFNTQKMNVIGLSHNDEVLVKIENEDEVDKISKKIAVGQKTFGSQALKLGIGAIDDIEEYDPEIDIDSENLDNDIIKVKLCNYGDPELNILAIRLFEIFCTEREIEYSRTLYSADLNIFKIQHLTLDDLNELKDFDGIQLISEMPIYHVTLDEIKGDEAIDIKIPEQDKEYPIIGVLDSGIAGIPHLAPWLLEDNFTKYHDDDVDKGHGTAVSGIIIYGDELEKENYTGFQGAKLFEAIVFPNNTTQGLSEDELIENIREAISENDHIKIWNLSLGTNKEADATEFSDFGKALDEIQEQHNVLICKSAGNCSNFKSGIPRSRISQSADTIRGLVVGSISKNKNTTDQSEKNHSSPFSRIGPGPSFTIKPEISHVGGNAGMDAYNRLILNPVFTFSKTGERKGVVGTSFSTPRISAILSQLNNLLSEEFNPLLLKALTIHSAKYPQEMKMTIAEKLKHVGFGIPSNTQDILFNQPNEITLILQDNLEKGNFIEILDFPYPQSMVDEDGYFHGEITLTLVTAPVLDSSNGAEYCQSNIDVLLGTYDQKIDRDTAKPTIINPIGKDGAKNLLSHSLYSKPASKDFDNPYTKERLLVAYGDKFQPVKKWAVNLDEFTPSNKEKFLKNPKNWYLKIDGLFREFTETKAELQRITPSQEFCLIITIKDTKNEGHIYNEVTQLLDSYNFIHQNVRLKESVRVQLKS
ncbi:S8 family peptidase [Chryseobacterium wangxinyae]|uniref:S8 family peptidase n=1 Tax=Chryseobacterium sp. CY350 TaxID=2997336 RepID=UPI00226E15BC|nr:S8 family peptidase [Chryseobacterium sp. CY350]MCY0977185.1 S8 family peptidase [Chryseobacterium sp. CY350]WBZ95794.1 S8 family peptidase [Chryseobacterium sp. CY350]